ncbi:BCCT family transporter, partial [Deferrisoma palaeochoriense]
LIASFFITSADSATYVVSTFSTGGAERASRRLIVFWGAALGLVAAALVYAGGLKGLQTASIVGSLPFLVVMVLLIVSTVRDMAGELRNAPPNP